MTWKVLKTDDDYGNASMRLMEIFHAEPNTPEGNELKLLLALVEEYDNKHYQLSEN